MSTNSSICMLGKDGKVKEIYCHWDGYLDYNGNLLINHYKDPEKVKSLIALGSISSLGEELIDEIVRKYGFGFAYNEEAKKEYTKEELDASKSTIAYHRDRGEKLSITEYKNLREFFDNMRGYNYREFTYLYIEEEKTWYLLLYYEYPTPEVNLRTMYNGRKGKMHTSEDFKYYFLDEFVERYSCEEN